MLSNHIHVGAVQHFLHFDIISNQSLSASLQRLIHTDVLSGLLDRLFEIVTSENSQTKDIYIIKLKGISEFFEQLFAEAFSHLSNSFADEVRECDNKNKLNGAENLMGALFAQNGLQLVRHLLRICFLDLDHISENEVRYDYLSLIVQILTACKNGPLRSMSNNLTTQFDRNTLQAIQNMLSRLSIGARAKQVRLNSFNVERPISLHMLTLIRALSIILELKPNLIDEVQLPCWNSLYM